MSVSDGKKIKIRIKYLFWWGVVFELHLAVLRDTHGSVCMILMVLGDGRSKRGSV